MRVLLIILAITSSSCSTVKFQPVQLPLPPEIPQQDRLTQEELKCLSDATLGKIILLDKRRKTLRGIIESTRQ